MDSDDNQPRLTKRDICTYFLTDFEVAPVAQLTWLKVTR